MAHPHHLPIETSPPFFREWRPRVSVCLIGVDHTCVVFCFLDDQVSKFREVLVKGEATIDKDERRESNVVLEDIVNTTVPLAYSGPHISLPLTLEHTRELLNHFKDGRVSGGCFSVNFIFYCKDTVCPKKQYSSLNIRHNFIVISIFKFPSLASWWKITLFFQALLFLRFVINSKINSLKACLFLKQTAKNTDNYLINFLLHIEPLVSSWILEKKL